MADNLMPWEQDYGQETSSAGADDSMPWDRDYGTESRMPARGERRAASSKKSRSFGQAALDTAVTFGAAPWEGAASIGDFVAPGNSVSKEIHDTADYARERFLSDQVKADRAKLQEALNSDSLMENAAGVGRFMKDAPLQTAAEALGTFVLPGGAVKGAGKLAQVAGLGAKGVARAGLAGGAVAGGALSGGDAAGSAYQQVAEMPDEVILRDPRAADMAARGVPMADIRESLAQRAGRDASIIPALVGAAGGMFGAERIFAGAGKHAGGMVARGAKGFASEALQEAAEEGITQYEGNRAAAKVDPTIDTMQGVGGAAIYGGALGGVTGGTIGAITKEHDLAATIEAQRKAAADKLDSATTVGDMIDAASEMATRPEDDIAEASRNIAKAKSVQDMLDSIGDGDYLAADTARLERLREAVDRNAERVAALNEAGGAPAADPNNRKPLTGDAYAADLAVQEQLQEFGGRALNAPLSEQLPATNTSDVGPRPTPEQRQAVVNARRTEAGLDESGRDLVGERRQALAANEARRRAGLPPLDVPSNRADVEPAVQWVDKTPLTDETEARRQLAQLRERAPEFGVNPNDMVLDKHPTQDGAFAVRIAPGREPAVKHGASAPRVDSRMSPNEASDTARQQGKDIAAGRPLQQGRDGSTAKTYPEGLQPLTMAAAKMRLEVLRAQAKAAGQEPPTLTIERHPSVKGIKPSAGIKREPAFVLVQRPVAPVEQMGPAKPVDPRSPQERIDTAAAQAKPKADARAEQLRTAADGMLRNIEQRGGVASPEEASFLEANGYGKPYDRIDTALGAKKTGDEKLSGATGIDVTPSRNKVADRRVANEPNSEPLPRFPAIYGADNRTDEQREPKRETRVTDTREPWRQRDVDENSRLDPGEDFPRDAEPDQGDTRQRPPVVSSERTADEDMPQRERDVILGDGPNQPGPLPEDPRHGAARRREPDEPGKFRDDRRRDPPKPPEEPMGPQRPKPPEEKKPKPPKEPKEPDGKKPPEPEDDDDAPRTPVSDADFTAAMRTVENNAELKAAIQARSLPKAAAALQKSNNPAVRRVGELIKNLVGQVTIKSWPTKAELRRLRIDETRVGGFYMPFYDTLTINPGRAPGATDREGSEWVVAHELVHALLSRVIDGPTDAQKPYVKQLKELFAHAKQQMRGESWYGLTDVHEFMSEAFTNVKFQQRIAKIPYQRGNVWSRFVKTLARMLGMNSNVLTEALTLGEKLARGKREKAKAVDRGKVYMESLPDAERNALEELSRTDALFALPKSAASDMKGIVADNDPSLTVKENKYGIANETEFAITLPSGNVARITVRDQGVGPRWYTARHNVEEHSYDFEAGGRPGRNAESVEELGDVWIDVSKLQPGDNGALIYNIAATYAHNTNRIFIGDPNGFTAFAMIRRAEHMLSSALKFGTTKHLGPHAFQVEGHPDKPHYGRIDWVYGDDLGNIRKLIDFNLRVQGLRDDADAVVFDPETGRYTAKDGTPLSRADIHALRQQGVGARGLAGGNTVARTALLRALRGAADGSGSRAGGKPDVGSVRPADAEGRPGSGEPRGAAAQGGLGTQRDLFEQGGSDGGRDGRPVGLLERLVRIASEHAAATDRVFYHVDPSSEADPTADNYRALEGRKVRYTVKVEDTGETATVTNDAARALREYDDRLSTMRQLIKCLA